MLSRHFLNTSKLSTVTTALGKGSPNHHFHILVLTFSESKWRPPSTLAIMVNWWMPTWGVKGEWSHQNFSMGDNKYFQNHFSSYLAYHQTRHHTGGRADLSESHGQISLGLSCRTAFWIKKFNYGKKNILCLLHIRKTEGCLSKSFSEHFDIMKSSFNRHFVLTFKLFVLHLNSLSVVSLETITKWILSGDLAFSLMVCLSVCSLFTGKNWL